MFSDPKITAFEVCLQRVLAGESIEQAVAAYPAWAEEFRPMLRAALDARQAGFHQRVPKAALARSRARFLRAAQQRQQSNRRLLPAFPAARLALATLFILVLLVLSGAVTVTLAAQSLPGELLYNLKLIGEQTQLRLTKDPVRRLELQQSFDNERLEEVDRLIRQERSTPVNFVGALLETGESIWQVGDVTVHLNAQTSLEGDLHAGLNVGVQGMLQQDGSVIASRIWDRAFMFTGELMGISAETWYVSGVDILILPQTRIAGIPEVGSRLEMLIVQMADGNWAARVVNVVSRGTRPPAEANPPAIKPSPTRLAPAATEEDRPEPSPTPKPTRTPQPTETRDSNDGGGDDREHQGATSTPENTRTPKPSKTPEPGDDEEKDPTSTPTRLISPTQSPTPKPSKTPEPEED